MGYTSPETKRKWRLANPEKVRKHKRDSWERNKDASNEKRRQDRVDNPTKYKAYTKRKYAKNKNRIKKTNKQYRQENPEKVSEWHRNYKAKKKGAEGFHTQADIDHLLESQNYLCNGCDKNLEQGFHVDHIIPLSRDGTNWSDNLQLLCPACNLSKNKKTMEEWMAVKEKENQVYGTI